ncbi:MAG TPA: hypothetical protein VEH27_06900 [Methylomirabilota bacterium]|nr:hypothetical protein [Methylomirabilota bacterium]
MDVVDSIFSAVGAGSALLVGAFLGIFCLIEYVKEDGFDPDAWRVTQQVRRRLVLLTGVGVGVGTLFPLSKGFLYFGATILEAAGLFWFFYRVPTQPPKMR